MGLNIEEFRKVDREQRAAHQAFQDALRELNALNIGNGEATELERASRVVLLASKRLCRCNDRLQEVCGG